MLTRIALGITNAVFSFVMLLISAQDIVTYQGETLTDKSENMKDIVTLSCCPCSIATNMNQIQDTSTSTKESNNESKEPFMERLE